ncbi:MAG: hypothetical protein V4598_17390 [Bdellovibrionota bacterium]
MRFIIAFTFFTFGMIFLRQLKDHKERTNMTLGLNLGVVWYLFFLHSLPGSFLLAAIVVIHYYLIDKKFINYFLPVLTICLFRFFPQLDLIGVSFLCFRLLSATLERSAGELKSATLKQYLFYCFYLPTYKLGPIGRFQDHLQSWEEEQGKRWNDLNWPQLARVAYGIVKYIFLSVVVLNYSRSLNFDLLKSAQSFADVLIMGSFLYVSLYLSFSGFNDIAIGLSHFLGFRMKENFNHPFLARSVGDFWSRWHISLTDLLKELVFYPFNQHFIRKFGKNSKYVVTPASFILLFVAIGLWHAFSMNFFILGLFYAFGAITAFYWPVKSDSRVVVILGMLLTQIYIAVSFYIFHVDFHTLKMVLGRITGLHL